MLRGALVREGRPVALGQKGLSLLQALLEAPTQVLSKTALMEAAWSDAVVEESNLSVQIAALRKLLGPQPDGSEWIATVPRTGYRFAGSVRVLDAAADGALPSPAGRPVFLKDRPSRSCRSSMSAATGNRRIWLTASRRASSRH
ncbi:transcriptional regulator [Mesorhizobium sp. M1312]|uniref:winged helix-turn-helix domain-containing protein n=1 Tax=Mesorhizobium sp. M1393 TaxID=2957094 RepID=UPI0033373CEA